MENKYYIPNIEDLRVGYLCEIHNYNEFNEDEWVGCVIGEAYNSKDSLRNRESVTLPFPELLRTPYLTKEQIEKEGWNLVGELDLKNHYYGNFIKNGNELRFWTNDSYVEIFDKYEDILYQGTCPSINEFRTICKLLNIKNEEKSDIYTNGSTSISETFKGE